MARQLKVVSPEGILHFVLDETTAKGDFCRAHGLRPAAPHRKFFCCESDEKPGGYWWCASCSKCFHHACKAHAVKENGEPIDGNNKVCKQCHAHIMAPSARASRKRSRDGA